MCEPSVNMHASLLQTSASPVHLVGVGLEDARIYAVWNFSHPYMLSICIVPHLVHKIIEPRDRMLRNNTSNRKEKTARNVRADVTHSPNSFPSHARLYRYRTSTLHAPHMLESKKFIFSIDINTARHIII